MEHKLITPDATFRPRARPYQDVLDQAATAKRRSALIGWLIGSVITIEAAVILAYLWSAYQ